MEGDKNEDKELSFVDDDSNGELFITAEETKIQENLTESSNSENENERMDFEEQESEDEDESPNNFSINSQREEIYKAQLEMKIKSCLESRKHLREKISSLADHNKKLVQELNELQVMNARTSRLSLITKGVITIIIFVILLLPTLSQFSYEESEDVSASKAEENSYNYRSFKGRGRTLLWVSEDGGGGCSETCNAEIKEPQTSDYKVHHKGIDRKRDKVNFIYYIISSLFDRPRVWEYYLQNSHLYLVSQNE